MKFKKLISTVMACAMAASVTAVSAFADETLANGSYTGTIHFHNASNPANYSMCDSIFVHEADITLTDDAAELTFYVAYPIPAFRDQGTDGTIKDVKMTVDGTEYTGTSDITTKAVKTFDTAGALFGIDAGEELPTQAVTFSLPRSSVESFENGIAASAYVNVFMNSTTEFVVKITDLKKAVAPTETSTQSTQITAEVAAPAPTYTVTVPESVAMGTLSTTEDTTKEINVKFESENLGSGHVDVSAAAAGELVNGDNKLAFTNDFGTKTFTAATSAQTGHVTVKAADVAKAAAGNYTGKVNFSIAYFAPAA